MPVINCNNWTITIVSYLNQEILTKQTFKLTQRKLKKKSYKREADSLSRPTIPTSYSTSDHRRIGETLARQAPCVPKHKTQNWILKYPNQTVLALYITERLLSSTGDSRRQSSAPASQPNQRGLIAERSKKRETDHDLETQQETSDNSHPPFTTPK